jgi:hypothetical protein
LTLVLVPYVLVIGMERRLGHAPLSFMSSGLEGIFVRDGVPRCMGSFRNPDTLGTVGATFLPCFVALAFSARDRVRALAGVFFCLVIVWLSHSGGSMSAAGVAVVGWGMWWFRKRMRVFRWGLLGGLVLLDIVMKAPVWYLLDRVSSITGGTGWHRAYLIDVTVRHFGEWWLAGMPVRDTQGWFHYTIGVTGGADITNHYIMFALTAGVGALALVIYLLTRAFSRLGVALARVRRGGDRYLPIEAMLWGLGVMLAVHAVNWLGISYFDQIYVIWLLQLAAISACSGARVARFKRRTDARQGAGEAGMGRARSTGSVPVPVAEPC